MNHILIIEDDPDIRESLRILLESENFLITEAKNGSDGLNKFSVEINLVILDIMMPGISGIQICEEIRKRSVVPILFLTAKLSEEDKITGFTAGADDYLVKPFSSAELLSRINALLRRHQVYDTEFNRDSQKEEWIERHGIVISSLYNDVYMGEKELCLTDIEYRMLLLLMKYPGKIFSIQNLYESVWQEPFYKASANTIMVHIRKLRSKIEEDPQNPKIIRTVWGKGYTFG